KNRAEFVRHKGYDDNLAHGFITISIIHHPRLEESLDNTQKREQIKVPETILNNSSEQLKEKEKNEEQSSQMINVKIGNETPKNATDHSFEDHTFSVSILCDFCNRKIWMKAGRKCANCPMNIHKKCEAGCMIETKCPLIRTASKVQIKTVSDDDLKHMVVIDEQDVNNKTITPNEHDDSTEFSLENKNISELASTRTPNTTRKISTTAAAYFSAVESRVYNKWTNKFTRTNDQHTALNSTTASPPLILKNNENSNNISSPSSSQNLIHNTNILTDSRNSSSSSLSSMIPQQQQSKLASFSNSAYTKFLDLKQKRPSLSTSMLRKYSGQRIIETQKNSINQPENISISDVKDIIMKCLSDSNSNFKDLEDLLHERCVDETTLYARAKEFGPELFPELNVNERKQKLDSEITKLQHEINLQCQIRDETIRDNANVTDENEKRKIESKVTNIDEKIQALAAMVILYCSGLKYCSEQTGSNDNEQEIDETVVEFEDTQSLLDNSIEEKDVENQDEEEEEEEEEQEEEESIMIAESELIRCDDNVPITKDEHIEKLDTSVDQAKKQIKEWLNKPIRVAITDGRVLVGILLCTDRDQNIILGNCNEYIGCPCDEEFRVLGLALVPGQHIQSIYIDDTQQHNENNDNHSINHSRKTTTDSSNINENYYDK
ncbi:unnamed protein product, partial [Didymodactylos carnosus]